MAKKPTIVEAAGSSSSSLSPGGKSLASLIEQAMSDETQKCFDEGETHPDVIRERKLAARERVKAEVAKAEAAAVAAAAEALAEKE